LVLKLKPKRSANSKHIYTTNMREFSAGTRSVGYGSPMASPIPQAVFKTNHEKFLSVERAGFKQGHHATFYHANGDRYCGEWKDDKRHGG
jgi:hypothetical protein